MDSKPFFASVTFWGAILAVAGPLLNTLLGIEFPGGTDGLAEQIATLIGGALAIYGRFRAKTALTVAY